MYLWLQITTLIFIDYGCNIIDINVWKILGAKSWHMKSSENILHVVI